MQYQCDMIRDLLPLYCDEACSKDSREVVEEHLKECELCSKMLDRMQDQSCDDCLQQEKEMIMGSYIKNVKKKAAAVLLGVVGMTLFVCLTVNIATGNAVDWFFIVLTALMLLVSITAVPLLAVDKKGLWTFGSFTVSLQLLLMVCCLYSGGNWFFIACISTLLGMAVVFLPFVIKDIPIKGFSQQHKGLILLGIDTVLLYLLIIVCGIYSSSGAYWKPAFVITTISVSFVWSLFVVIRYGKANGFIKSGICVILTGIFEASFNGIIEWALGSTMRIRMFGARLGSWNSDALINANIDLLIFITCCAIGGALLLFGMLRRKKGGSN